MPLEGIKGITSRVELPTNAEPTPAAATMPALGVNLDLSEIGSPDRSYFMPANESDPSTTSERFRLNEQQAIARQDDRSDIEITRISIGYGLVHAPFGDVGKKLPGH